MTRRLFQFVLPLITLIMWLAVCHVGYAAQRAQTGAPQKRRVALRGHLTGTREIQQVVVWQTLNPKSNALPYAQAHLAIETISPNSRAMWQADGGQSQYLVDAVQAVDLDGDGTPEIVSLWWVGASAGAALRVFHWDRDKQSFVELQSKDSLGGIRRYRIAGNVGRGQKSSRRIIVYGPSNVGAGRLAASGAELELRGSELVRVGGGGAVTTQGDSGIEGQTFISPTRPGPIRMGQGPDRKPYQTTLVVMTAGEGREVARLETGSDGRFRVSLPPGEYRIGPPPAATRFLPRASEEMVKVLPGQFAQVTIHFDSGMR